MFETWAAPAVGWCSVHPRHGGSPSCGFSSSQRRRWGRRMRALTIPNVTCREPLARSALYPYMLNQINLTKTDDLWAQPALQQSQMGARGSERQGGAALSPQPLAVASRRSPSVAGCHIHAPRPPLPPQPPEPSLGYLALALCYPLHYTRPHTHTELLT